MEYEGLTRDDLENVHAMNNAWLRLDVSGRAQLTVRGIERLAEAPFLLFSFREHDDGWWDRLLGERRQQDLLQARVDMPPELRHFQAAGLAFLWELARRNPYAARIVSGSPLHRCEQIATATPVQILEAASASAIVAPRFEDESSLQRRLMHSGGSSAREKRMFAQIGALQSMLTRGQFAAPQLQYAAACKRSPSRTSPRPTRTAIRR